MRRLRAAFATLALALAAIAAPALARAGDSTVLIVDASGSMAERIGPETRLDAARAAVLAELAHWPPNREVALVAYGHRRAGDCNDIETLLPLGPVDATAIRTSLAKLRARGKTPLSAALRKAASLLPEAGGTIVLVSDGLETCHDDPCAVADDLRRAHAALVIHVIGFGMPEKDMAALACIAGAGGRAIDAKDGAALSKALTDVAEGGTVAAAVPAQAPPVAPAPPPAASPAPAPPVVTVRLEAVVGTTPVPGAVRWTIVPKGATEPVYQGASRALDLQLAVGNYHVAIEGSNAKGGGDLAVEDKPGETLRVRLDAGLVRLSLLASPGKPIAETDLKGAPAWHIEPMDRQPPASLEPILAPDALLRPGRYRVTGTLGRFSAGRVITVSSGKVTEEPLDLQLGRVTLEAVIDGTSEPIGEGAGLDWSLAPLSGEAEPETATGLARPIFVAPAGAYKASVTIAGARFETPVTIEAGSEASGRVVLPASGVTLEAGLGPGSPVFDDWRDARWTVTPVALLGGAVGAPALDDRSEARPSVTLLPGEWRVVVVSGVVRTETLFRLAPGERRTLRLDLGAGRLTMAAKPASGPPPSNIVFSAFAIGTDGTPDHLPVATGGAREEFAAVLPAGRYRITASDETGRMAADDLVLGAGETRRLDFLLR